MEFDDGKGSGIVLWQRIPLLFILRDDDSPDTVSYSSAIVQPEIAVMSVSDSILGQELDALGRVMGNEASQGQAAASQERPIFGVGTQLADMATISRPMHTGITAVDALTPIGKGQNMLIVGSEPLGRRRLALDSAITQAKEGTVVVYVDLNGDKDDVVPYLKAASPDLENMVIVRGVCSASSAGGKEAPDAGLGVAAAASGASVLPTLPPLHHLPGLSAPSHSSGLCEQVVMWCTARPTAAQQHA